jgi:hypothetical protein
MKGIFFGVTGDSILWHRLLLRSVHGSVFIAAIFVDSYSLKLSKFQ